MLGYQAGLFVRQRVPLMRLIIRRKWIFLALALLPVIAACWGIVWLTPKLKARQSQEFLKVAEGYLDTGKTREAVISLNSSLRLMPDNPSALRLLARIQTAQGDPVALDNWNKLLATGKVRLEDIIMCAQVAANQQDWALADRMAKVTEAFGNKGFPHLVRAGLLRSKGDTVAVESELRQAVEKDETLSSKLALVKFLLSQQLTKTSSMEVFEILKEVSKVQDASGAEALFTALAKGIVPANELPNWLGAIRAHPNSNQSALCLADYTEVVIQPSSREFVIAKMSDRVKGGALKDRAEAMVWMLRMGEPALAGNLLSISEALQSDNYYYPWLDAHLMSGEFELVLKSLDEPSNPIKESYLNRLYKASAHHTAGHKQESEDIFKSVYEEIRGDRKKLLKSLIFFSTSKQEMLFDAGYEQILCDSASASESFKSLLPTIYSQRDSAVALKFYEITASNSPQLAGDIAFQNDLIYLRILMGKQQAAEMAGALSQANPMDESLRITHAFAVLKSGNSTEALKILEASEQSIVESTLLPHQKAVVTAILAANGQEKEAELVTRMVQPNQLSVQEIQLVQNSFSSRKEASPPPTSAMSSSPKAANKPKR